MNQFPIQNLNLQGSIPDKKDIQINLKDKARNRNRNPSRKKNSLIHKKMINNNQINAQNNKNATNIQKNIVVNIQNNNPTVIQNNNPTNIQNINPIIIQNNNQTNIKNINPTIISNINPTNIQNNNPINNKNPQQQTQIQPIKRMRKTAQKPTNIIRRNSKSDFNWLNKYFIYRHESLNKYLNNNDFKLTLENSKDNYEKLIRQLFNNRANANMQINDKNILQPTKLLNNNNINTNIIPEKKYKKIFIVTGGYCDVVSNLKERGWEQEKNPSSLDFDYIWTLKTNEINFMLLKNYQLSNHYFRNGQITRKSGLGKNIKNLYFRGIDPMNFFPRCYDLSIKLELEDFRQDFKFTWAISLLKLLQKEEQEISRISPKSNKFSNEVISTAVNIVERNLKYLSNKGIYIQNINELKNSIANNNKFYLISDEEWNKIYLPELTQNSNVQDIIYEVNSNKPGGINNPIKGNNKTVPKKIIKPNDTKKMLVNTQKAQAGNLDKFSPNLNSYNGLKSKIEKMNKEEKKNNLNLNDIKGKPINVNIIKKRNSRINNSTTNTNIIKNLNNSNSLKNGEGAIFDNYKEKITEILSFLEKNLPQYKLNGFRNIWIMKPSNLSRGRGVTCVDSLLPIEQSLSATNDSGLIVQKYIENPLIIQNRKFDIRQWVLVTSLNPLIIWMWKEPYIRFGAEDYKMDDLNNIYSHLTNNSIAKHSKQYKTEKKFEGDMWTCFEFEKFLGSERWKEIHLKIKNAIICSFYAAHQEIKQRYNSHELYGYDFMIDEEFNVYLIEVNASPALDYSTKITERAVKDMVKDLIKIVIDNNNARDCEVNSNGEIINRNPEIIPNKFIQIFNENKHCIKIPENVPNKSMFY